MSTAEEFLTVLQEAVSVRVRSAPDLASCRSHSGPGCSATACCGMLQSSEGNVEMVYGKARVGVLYSGGVDSVVLAALVDRLALHWHCTGWCMMGN